MDFIISEILGTVFDETVQFGNGIFFCSYYSR